MILFDTDVCITLLKGNRKILDSYGKTAEEICVSEITAQELFLLANKTNDPAQTRVTVEKFLLTVRVLYPDLEVLKYAADIQNSLIKKGVYISYQDLIIFCLSKVYSAKLITTNGKRYCFT